MILLIEDEVDILNNLKDILEQNNYQVLSAKSIKESKEYLEKNLDLIILDVTLPDGDGFEFYKMNIKEREIPTIFLTAKDLEDDIVKGLYAGADDYLVKPFSFQELEARITALLRRNKEKRTSELVCGDLILDCNTRRARRGDHEMELTVKEYRLLEHFMNNQGIVLSRVNLLKHVWDKNFDTNTNVVDVYVNYLRTKIDKDYENKLIHTVVGLGYIMESH